jgi:hypothetical protein
MQYTNNRDGSQTVQFGAPWLSSFFSGGQDRVYLIPNPQSGPYPIKQVTISRALTGVSGIRVEVQTDKTKMGSGTLSFSGCPIPFGAEAAFTSQGRMAGTDTWFYECRATVPEYIQAQFFFKTGDIHPERLMAVNNNNFLAEFYKIALAYVFPPGRLTLFNYPNNFVALAANTYCFGDPRQPKHTMTINGKNFPTLESLFNYGSGPGNLLRCQFVGTPPNRFPPRAADDLFDLTPWQPPPGPGIIQITADSGPDGIGSDSSVVRFSATRNGAPLTVTGASVRIDDMDGDPPVLTWTSFGNLQNGDVVTMVFRNEAIPYLGGRTITGTIAPRP